MATTTAIERRVLVAVLLGVLGLLLPRFGEAFVPSEAPERARGRRPDRSLSTTNATPTTLRMGLIDAFRSRFGTNNNGDFVRLDQVPIGPGPVVLLYRFPNGIDDDEVLDILADGAPLATQKGISIARIASLDDSETAATAPEPSGAPSLKDGHEPPPAAAPPAGPPSDPLIDLSLRRAIDVVRKRPRDDRRPPPFRPSAEGSRSPVVIFSGFSNAEMMDSYNILGEEVYKEGVSSYGRGEYLACATAVPNAMKKPLRRVLEEISGDHAAAMGRDDEPPIEPN